MMTSTAEKRLVSTALLLCWLTSPAQAADPALQATPAAPLQAEAAAPFQLPPITDAQTAPAQVGSIGGVRVTGIEFVGNSVLASAELQAIAAPYVGRVVTAAELQTLRQALTQAYVARGYVNSGVLLPRQIVDGVVVFTVQEGRLAAIRLHGMERLDERYLTLRLTPDPAAPLNLEQLRERFQLLLADPLIARLNARVLPGIAPGEAILDIEVTRAPAYQFSAFVNNYRPASIGSESVGVTAQIHNLTTLGDVLDASVQSPPHRRLDPRSTLAWQLPLGFAGTRMSVALERGNSSVVEEPSRVLDIRSRLNSLEVGISHQLLQSLSQRLSIGLNRVSRSNRTWLLGEAFSFTPGQPDGVTQERLWRFWQDYSVRSETQVLALRSTLSYGTNSLQDTAGLPDTPSAPIAARQFQVWLGQAQLTRVLADNGLQLTVRATVQQTQNRLLALDGLALGGVNSVRGYRENQLVRDRGAFVNVELAYPLVRDAASAWQLTLMPFYDHGRAQNVGEEGLTLASWGLASRWQWQRFQLDVALAKRLRRPNSTRASEPTWQDRGVHWQLTYKF